MRKLFLFLCIAGAVLFLLRPEWYLKNKRAQIDPAHAVWLTRLGDSALVTNDVPVAALLLFRGQIIGAGYNTVHKDRSAAGHAEINAISNAMQHIGVDSFLHLDRHQLTLITTWEPCPMCKGAIVEYNIPHVTVIKTKSMSYWAAQWKKALLYEWHKQATASDSLQNSLFKQHPQYEKEKDNL